MRCRAGPRNDAKRSCRPRDGSARSALTVAGSTRVSARRRLVRLVRTGSLRVAARAARRELVWRRHEAAVARAAREGQPLLVGPFLGEVGFELLYWIPLVRRLLAEHGVGRDGVTVLGGEPMAQPGGLAALLGRLKERGMHTVVYTGYTLEALATRSILS